MGLGGSASSRSNSISSYQSYHSSATTSTDNCQISDNVKEDMPRPPVPQHVPSSSDIINSCGDAVNDSKVSRIIKIFFVCLENLD